MRIRMAAAAAAKSLQSCPTLCDPIDGSPPGSPVPGILQARILKWVAISFSNACIHAKSLQSGPTLCDPMDSSPPGSSAQGILQARILEWVAISFSNNGYIVGTIIVWHLEKVFFFLSLFRSWISFCLFFKVYLFFGCAGSSVLWRLLPSCGEWRLLSSSGAQASYCDGFSCGSQALGSGL